MKALKERLDKSNPHEVIGMDLVQAEQMTISEIDSDENWQVLGSGALARNLLQKTLAADMKRAGNFDKLLALLRKCFRFFKSLA